MTARTLPKTCRECGGWIPTPEQRDLSRELRQMRRKYNQLHAAAVAVASNFETYGSQIKVTVPMALLERLQHELSREGNG